MHTKIKTLQDALKALGTTAEAEFPDKAILYLTDDELAYRELKLITKALNQADGKEWTPDWNNGDERKFYCWFWMDNSGSGFSRNGYYCDNADTRVGSRLCFKSRELAIYAAEQFLDIYKRYMTIS